MEYGLLLTGIAFIIAVSVFLFGGGVTDLFTVSCTEITTEAAPGTDCTP